jgi:capsid protein
MGWWEPWAAYWSRKRFERRQYELATQLLEASPSRVCDDDDACRWKLVGGGKETHPEDAGQTRDLVRRLVDTNPFARNALTLYRNYVVGTGMRHEVLACPAGCGETRFELSDATVEGAVAAAGRLWRRFLDDNHWETGSRRDWEFCVRTWRDGECFVRLFRQPDWPPRIHFVDPERIGPDPVTGLPTDGIATDPRNVEAPIHYLLHHDDRTEAVPADRFLHCKIGVDANVKRGVSIFAPVLDALRKYQSWLDVELIHRKVASSIVLVRKHTGQSPAGVAGFADWAAQQNQPACTPPPLSLGGRHSVLQPGTLIDSQGYDLQYLSPDSHFDDATILGRRLLLAVAAGTGLPEFMLSADAANANYSSTLVAEGPAVRLFAAWQAFFIGQWQSLFRMVMHEAVRLGLLPSGALGTLRLKITPPVVAVRNRKDDAEADAIYFDRGALSRRELARRDQADPIVMERERGEEAGSQALPGNPLTRGSASVAGASAEES